MKILENINFANPEMFLSITALFLLMLGVFLKQKPDITKKLFALTAIAFGIAIYLLISAKTSLELAEGTKKFSAPLFNNAFIFDNFSYFAKFLISLIGIAICTIGMNTNFYAGQSKNIFEFPVLVILSFIGMFVLVSANDLMTLYLGLELQSLSIYILVAINRDSESSTESAIKYFVLGALASGIILFGASLVYGFSGSTNLSSIATIFQNAHNISEISPALIFGMVLIIAGLFFKLSAVPMHMWAPDVYEGATKTVVAIIATAPKVAALSFLIRFITKISPEIYPSFSKIVVIVSALSMILGSFAALRQSSFKRLLAYSSIANIGYLLIGVAVGTPIAIQYGLLYLVVYIVGAIGVFSILSILQKNDEEIDVISHIAGLARKNPAYALALTIFMFSIAGIPPMAGFFGKFFVFKAALQSNFIILSLIGVVTSVIACYYYLKIIKTMYFDDAQTADCLISKSAGMTIKALIIICTAFTLGMIFFTDKILEITANATLSL